MTTALAIVAGGLGALARFEVGGWFVRRSTTAPVTPWGTLAVNLTGAALLGLLVSLAGRGTLDATWLRIAGTGFLGGFTTFSTWMVESVGLSRAGARRAATGNVIGMLLAGVALAALS